MCVPYWIVSKRLEVLEAHQLNLGLYTTRVTAEDLRCAIAEAEGTPSPLAKVEAALRDLVAQGEVIEWAPGLFRSRIAETVRCLRLLRQRLWWQKDLSEAPLLVEGIRVEFRQRRRSKRDAVSVSDAIPNEVPPEVARAFQEATFSIVKVQAKPLKWVVFRLSNGYFLD